MAANDSLRHHGRADTIRALVPENAYIIPADALSAAGGGSTNAGHRLFDFLAPTKESSAPHREVMLADGERVIAPEDVDRLGGYDALEALTTALRGGKRYPHGR